MKFKLLSYIVTRKYVTPNNSQYNLAEVISYTLHHFRPISHLDSKIRKILPRIQEIPEHHQNDWSLKELLDFDLWCRYVTFILFCDVFVIDHLWNKEGFYELLRTSYSHFLYRICQKGASEKWILKAYRRRRINSSRFRIKLHGE